MAELTDQHREILDFERDNPHWKHIARKQAAVRERFGMTATRYEQVLLWILDQPEALAYSPQLVRRLQRLIAGRAAQRSSRRMKQVS